ncbi:oxidoreductase [Paenibacillus sp. LC231]|uniref:Gfo/Idh/MocA family protein n=1 Tax=Paenibacillus sp. LC231 TaxID=1120679 RepID=UPI0008DE1097|nr:Gfo/Idh/MocA family oxidoreductase [Paenibacillus sp. LC231]OIB02116.1 oxidoreductase [Paenibacillus sp. LC231]
MSKKIKVAVVGMRFGAEFVPIYLHHPWVERVAICDSNPDTLNEVGNKFGVDRRFTSMDDLLASGDYDAVHLVTPVTYHAEHSIAVLNAGMHCACTIPMGLSMEELYRVLEAKWRSGKNYMMMETACYTREFLYAKEMYESGEMGKIQFMRCAHYQDMDGWPEYWKGFPPLMHPTHALGPVLDLISKRPLKVYALGSGSMREELVRKYNNPFPIETAIYQLEDSDVAVELTRTMFHTAKAYSESFNVYGEKASFEWQQIEEELPIVMRIGELTEHRGRPISIERVEVPDRAELLPKEIQRFTKRGVYDENNPHLSFLQGGGHGGSHPHLVHEFVSSIVEGRAPHIDEVKAATWTAAGICAHESALQGGREIAIPNFKE